MAGELSTTRKVRLHARIAESLEEAYGEEAEVHAAELAHHFAEAMTITGAEKLVHYSLVAGERTLAAYAWEEALAHFQRALAAKENQPMDAETAGLLYGLGRAQIATVQESQMQIPMDNLRRAFDYSLDVGDLARAVAVAVHPLPGNQRPEGYDLVERVLPLVSPDSHEAGRLLSLHGRFVGMNEGNYEGAQV